MKLIKKMLSVFLCLTVIIGSLSVGLFSVSAATVTKGTRGADGKGFKFKKQLNILIQTQTGKSTVSIMKVGKILRSIFCCIRKNLEFFRLHTESVLY